jgi:hypothetical protein
MGAADPADRERRGRWAGANSWETMHRGDRP